MGELRNEVLKAEAAIHQLAEELAKAKGINEQVKITEQRLMKAANALEQGCRALEAAQEELTRTAAQDRLALSSVSEENRKALEEARKSVREAVAQAQASLKSAEELLRQVSDQLSQSSQALPSSVNRAIKDFGERVRQTLQQAYQNMQEQLTTAIGKAQSALINAASSLMELRAGFEHDVSALTRQNEQILQHMAQQEAEIKRLSKWLKFCLVFVGLTILVSVTTVILLLIRQ